MRVEHKISNTIVAPLLLMAALLSSAAPSYSATRVSWCTITLKGLVVDSDRFFATLLPGESMNIKIEPNSGVANMEWSVSSGYLTGAGYERLYIAPKTPGRYPLKVTALRLGEKVEAVVQIFVMVPSTEVSNNSLNGFEIGEYPDPKKRRYTEFYEYPRGFMEINKGDTDVYLTENYQVHQFLPHGYSKWPKYLLLDEHQALKLELITRELRARGLMTGRFTIWSGFRPPARNQSPGQAEYSQHQWGRATDVIIDDGGRKGTMDDLNGDGKVDLYDALVIYTTVDEMEESGILKGGLEGGIGAYAGTSKHGPFVHLDWRDGGKARWINDERHRRVKNIAQFLKENQHRISPPARRYAYAGRTRHTVSGKSGGGININSLKDNIRDLEREVLNLEGQWTDVEAGPRPLTSSDLYMAADVANESMLLNRGKIIIKRMAIKEGKLTPRRPEGIGRIYQMAEGILEVRYKRVSPVWFHPEWAFIGSEVPAPVKRLRLDFFEKSRADNTLDLGAGIRIHPVNRSRSIALPGCIGVSESDIAAIQSHASVGTRVYMFEGGAFLSGSKKNVDKRQDLIALQSFLVLRRRAAELNREHLVFDMDQQRGWIKRGDKVIRPLRVKIVGPCFSKAFSNPRDHFHMPRGIMLVQDRSDYPEWYKPDWMYKQQNKPVPEPLGSGRIQKGLLGQYGLYLGGGVVIHGFHSDLVPDKAIDYVAIELHPDDLRAVWKTIPNGGVVIVQ